MERRRLLLAVLAYVVPTFALGFFWHSQRFAGHDQDLWIYRPDVIIPFGFGWMLVQGIVFSIPYERSFSTP